MPTLLSRLLCALAAAALALTAGLGLLAFAKFYSSIFLGQARNSSPACASQHAGPWAPRPHGRDRCSSARSRRGRSTRSAPACRRCSDFNPATTTISHPLVLGPVFTGFSVLAPTWLSIDLPAYALLALR